MDDTLPFNQYVRTPFQVKAIEITDENIEKIAEMVGEVKVEHGKKYISINRRIVPIVGRAYVGWFLTVFGDDNLRCYAPDVFNEQFQLMPESRVLSFHFPEDNPVQTFSGDFVPALTVEDLEKDLQKAVFTSPSEVREEIGSAPPFEGGV